MYFLYKDSMSVHYPLNEDILFPWIIFPFYKPYPKIFPCNHQVKQSWCLTSWGNHINAVDRATSQYKEAYNFHGSTHHISAPSLWNVIIKNNLCSKSYF